MYIQNGTMMSLLVWGVADICWKKMVWNRSLLSTVHVALL